MKKAKIYIPSKTAMQSGRGKTKKWVLKFETRHDVTNPLMGWESSDDTMNEVVLEFSSKNSAIEYAFLPNVWKLTAHLRVFLSQTTDPSSL